MVVGANAEEARRHSEYIEYSLGGVMSGPLDIKMDLGTGRFSVNDKRGLRQGQLSEAALAEIRNLAGASLSAGLRSQECVEKDRMRQEMRQKGISVPFDPPIMDAINVMNVRMGEKTDSTGYGHGECFSPEAKPVLKAVMSATN